MKKKKKESGHVVHIAFPRQLYDTDWMNSWMPTKYYQKEETDVDRMERQQIEVICEQNVQKVPLVRGMCLIKSLVKVENKCQQIEKKCGKWMRWHWSEKYISIYSCNTHTHTLHLLTTQFPCELLLLLLFGVVAYRHL